MFHHITLIRFRPDRPAQSSADALEAARRLEHAIPSVRAMSCGEALPADSHSWELAFHFEFADPEGFAQFARHDAHEAFVTTHIHPYLEAIVSVDYGDLDRLRQPKRRARGTRT